MSPPLFAVVDVINDAAVVVNVGRVDVVVVVVVGLKIVKEI
jgi:hypothetical protein